MWEDFLMNRISEQELVFLNEEINFMLKDFHYFSSGLEYV